MPISHAELLALMTSAEDEHLEFKEAKASFGQDKAIKYCCALANEGGGHLILGVTDKKPRMIVGSGAFPALEGLRAELVKRFLEIVIGLVSHRLLRSGIVSRLLVEVLLLTCKQLRHTRGFRRVVACCNRGSTRKLTG